MTHTRNFLLLLSFFLLPAFVQAEEDPLGLFPFFTMGENIADVWANPSQQKIAGADGQVVVDGDRFVTSGNGQEIRFWGVNFCASMNFPEKDQAVRYAKRIASFGINAVRLHHMDNREIWGKNFPDVTTLDPEKLDRLDWFIYQLKLNGVYVNINLHVSRKLLEPNGFSPQEEGTTFDKGVDNYEPRMIALQKKYAKELLSHVNPYTKMSYLEDPCICMIEINNENSLVSHWFWGNLTNIGPTYTAELQKQWNAWLVKKYGTTEKLREAWNCRTYPLEPNLVPDPGFDGAEPSEAAKATKLVWDLERGTSVSDLKKTDGVLRLTVEKCGSVAWNPQFKISNLAVQEGKPYTVKFRARAPKLAPGTTMQLNVACTQNHDPWGTAGLVAKWDATPEWRSYEFQFTGKADDEKTRVVLSGFQPGVYEFDDFSIQPGGRVGLAEDETLEAGTVPVLFRGKPNISLPKAGENDFINFIVDTETNYWLEMFHYVKDELGAKAPVTGTQMNYGSHWAQAQLDYCDAHAYWNHPSFPGRPWDGGNWKLGNSSISNALGNKYATVTSLANLRILGKPYTISEYNHPYPNLYGAEGFPLLASMAAFQNWSGIYIFAWSHSNHFSPEETPSFFDIKGNPVQLVHMAACWNLFLRGDVRDARTVPDVKPIEYLMSKASEREIFCKHGNTHAPLGFRHENPMLTAVGTRIVENADVPPKAEASEPLTQTVSSTGEIRWNGEVENRGFYQIDTPKTKVFSGFIQNRTFQFENGPSLKIEFGKTILDWATVSLTQTKPNHFLLSATGLQKNSDCVLGLYDEVVKDTPVEEYPNLINQQITFCQKRGHAPLMCEGIPASLTLEVPAGKTVRYFPLDGSASRMSGQKAEKVDETHVKISISPEFKTLWYEVVIED
ncbi:MAG: carbohydrate binding domain-containing protein [Thermoguttaceae bacterium]|nr:carbohydrate binding domain-containing protein [Thermoguttaceae bacterium]